MIHHYTCDKCSTKFTTGCFDSVKRYEYTPQIESLELSERILQMTTYKVSILCNDCANE